MPTQAQSDAARANGAKSRGPVTPEGKARSAQNAIKHGAYAETVLLDNESIPAFLELIHDYVAKFQPADAAEMRMVHRMAAASWREQRLMSFEAATINVTIARQRGEIDAKFSKIDEATRGAVAFSASLNESTTLSALHRAVAECGRQFTRALRDLEKMRKLAPAPAPAAAAPQPEPQPQNEPEPPQPPKEPTTQPTPKPAPKPQPAPEIEPNRPFTSMFSGFLSPGEPRRP